MCKPGHTKLCFLKHETSPGWETQLVEALAHTQKRLWVLSPVRAHTWVVGSISSQGTCERSLIDVSLSHFFLSLSINISLGEDLK